MKVLIYILIIAVISIALADRRLGRKQAISKTVSPREKYRHYKLVIIVIICIVILLFSLK